MQKLTMAEMLPSSVEVQPQLSVHITRCNAMIRPGRALPFYP
jgi:hypothetical protein